MGVSMKKVSILLLVLMNVVLLNSPVYSKIAQESEMSIATVNELNYKEFENRNGNASETTINRIITNEIKKEEYSQKYGEFKGMTLYYFEMLRKYIIPVCFIGLTIASLNYCIIGNKKLEKKEQGFQMILTFGIGIIVFTFLPWIYYWLLERKCSLDLSLFVKVWRVI